MVDIAQARTAIAARLGLDRAFQVAPEGRPPVWVDGLDVERAAVIEIVPVGDPDSWVLAPGTRVPTPIVDAARLALDTRLLRLGEVLADDANPMTDVHVYTDHPCAVDVLGDALGRTSLAPHGLVFMVGPVA